MEEILSSIRRIIADEEADDGGPGSYDDLGAAEARAEALDDDAEALAQAADDDDDAEDVLELTKVVRDSGEVVDLQGERPSADAPPPGKEAGGPTTGEPTAAEGSEDQELELAPLEDVPADEPVAAVQKDTMRKDAPVQTHPADAAADLLSTPAASVATGAFAKLSQALQRTPAEESVAEESGRTVEQFVEDIIRPTLKTWLDEHMPAIVERLVQKEIQKIARRAEFN